MNYKIHPNAKSKRSILTEGFFYAPLILRLLLLAYFLLYPAFEFLFYLGFFLSY